MYLATLQPLGEDGVQGHIREAVATLSELST